MPPPKPADLRQELLAAFAVEYRDHLSALRRGLAAVQQGGRADSRELFRRLHSLKGAARAVDLTAAEAEAHRLETAMAVVMETPSAPPAGWTTALVEGLDRLEAMIEAGLGTADPPRADPAHAPPPAEAAAHGFGYLPVDPAQVTDLVMTTGVLAQAVERQDRFARRLAALEGALAAARHEPAGLADVLRQAAGLRREAEDTAFQLGQSFRRLRDDVHRLGLVSAETVFGPLARMVRDLARAEGIAVETVFLGLGLAADRRLLQALKDPVTQLLRNAVSHGAERPAARRARGLPPALRILLSLTGGGASLLLTVSDDGPGPDLDAIRARAAERGLLSPEAAADAPVERVLAQVFEPGLSTRATVGPLSGRGMGLSIVAEAVQGLGGTARMRFAEAAADGRPARGTAVDLTLPLLLSHQSAVLLRFEDVTVALPAGSILRLLRAPRAAIAPLGGVMSLRLDLPAAAAGTTPRRIPVAVLGSLLGMAGRRLPVADGMVKLAVIRDGGMGEALALAVDEFEDVRRFLTHRAEIAGMEPDLVAGLVMVTSDRPAALLAPEGIFTRWRQQGGWGGEDLPLAPDVAVAGKVPALPGTTAAPTILVVDDSITSRTLEKSILETHGYRVLLAVDGAEALAMLRAAAAGGRVVAEGVFAPPMIDLVLADVEMPRMDGFTLLATMKDDADLRRIPVIIMTSRDTAGDVRRGLDLGASAYIAKQSFDQQDLLMTIGRLL